MKFIQKSSFTPEKLQQWLDNLQKDDNGCLINCRYNNLPSYVHEDLHTILLQEQGFLCCYTGLLISIDKSHIEHIKPQSISKKDPHDHDDVNYHNMLAAFPKEKNIPKKETKTKLCPFGAKYRTDQELPISPLDKNCEQKFNFDLQGKIIPVNENEEAQKTIDILNLNEESLSEMRETAIDEVFYPDKKPLSLSKIQYIIAQGYRQKDSKGRYPKFCFVIEKVAPLILQKAQREQKRTQAIRQQEKSKTRRTKL